MKAKHVSRASKTDKHCKTHSEAIFKRLQGQLSVSSLKSEEPGPQTKLLTKGSGQPVFRAEQSDLREVVSALQPSFPQKFTSVDRVLRDMTRHAGLKYH